MDWREKIAFKGDKILWYVIISLMICSVVLVYSATGRLAFRREDGNLFFYLLKQVGFMGICTLTLLVFQSIPWRLYYRYSTALLLSASALLLLTVFAGEDVHHAGRWLEVPYTGLTIQPSEYAKVVIVIYLARILSDFQEDWGCPDQVLKQCWLPLVVIVQIFLENFSTSALIGFICFLMLVIGRVRWTTLFKIGGTMLAGLLVVVLMGVAFPQTKEWGRIGTIVSRLTTFVGADEKEKVEAADYQSEQAKMAVARGGLMGCGPGNSLLRNFLPNASSDYIYAIIIEEYGLVGGIVILSLFLVVLFRTGVITRRCLLPDHLNPRGAPCLFPALTVMGLGMTIVLQAFFHMGVNVSLLPVTGQNLPLVSSGGTSLVFTSAALGIMLAIAQAFSPEGLAEEKEREERDALMNAAVEEIGRRERKYKPGPEEPDAAVEEQPEEEEEDGVPESGYGRRGSSGHGSTAPQRRSAGRADLAQENRNVDTIGEDGWDPEEEDDGGREVLEEIRRRGRRGSL